MTSTENIGDLYLVLEAGLGVLVSHLGLDLPDEAGFGPLEL